MEMILTQQKETENRLNSKIQNLEQECESLKLEIKTLNGFKSWVDLHLNEKDQLHGNVIQAKQKHEETAAEVARLTASYERVVQEKEILEQQVVQLQSEAADYNNKIEEQLEINSMLRSTLENTQSLNTTQAAKIKRFEDELEDLNLNMQKKQMSDLQGRLASTLAELEVQTLENQNMRVQEEQMKEIAKAAIQKSKALEQELNKLKEDAAEDRKTRNSRSRGVIEDPGSEQATQNRIILENEVKMLKIQLQTKEKTIESVMQKSKSLETAQLKSIQF